MADRDRVNVPAAAGPGAAYYMFSFMLLSSLLIVAAVLAGMFWLSRPVNMKPETNRLADALENVLHDNFIPAASIERGEPIAQAATRDGVTTRWNTHAFTVKLPPELNSDGLKSQLRKDMSAYFVRLTDLERDPESGNDRIALYLDELQFADLALVPAEREATPAYRSDLRNSSIQLANMVASVLAALPLERPFERAPAEDREDLGAVWHYTGFSAHLPPGWTAGELKGRLEEKNVLPNVTIGTEPWPGTDHGVLLSLAGKPAVGVACTLTPAADVVRPDPLSLDALLGGGIMGSEPEEVPATPAAPMVELPAVSPATPAPVAAPVPPIEPPAPRAATPMPTATPGGMARLAIIIDDGGNSTARAERFLALDNRLTLAILPNTPFAVEIAERGAALGFEIMLHMPMETDSGSEEAVPGTVFTAMGKMEIQALTNKALDQIPYVTGVNNHTGSKFTSNKVKMGMVLEVLKERGLFFVDSVTKHTSVAHAAAVELGVPAARRDVFLDNEAIASSIRSQFELLKQMALERGSAIGIGHFQSIATAEVLAEEIPRLAGSNIVLVHASELVQ